MGEVFLKEERIAGSKAIGIANHEGPPSSQFVFQQKTALHPGVPHALVIEYMCQAEGFGIARISDRTANLNLPYTGGNLEYSVGEIHPGSG